MQNSSMNNLTINQGVYTFATNGGDSRTMRQALYAVLGSPIGWIVLVLLYRWQLPELLPESVDSWLLNPFLIVGLTLVVSALTFVRLSKGSAARFAVEIDPGQRLIRARDRVEGVQMWEDRYDPENLFIAQIQVIVQGEPYFYPTLVYGDPDRDPAFRFVSMGSDALNDGQGEEEVADPSQSGSNKGPLVEESVPYSDRAVLGYGELEELQILMRKLGVS